MHSILGLDAENFANSLSNQKTEVLLKQLNSNTQYVNNFLTTEAEKDKTTFYMANTEAQLKGFSLSKMLTKYPRDKEERDCAEHITKQAMLELQGKQIPKGEYSGKLLRTLKISLLNKFKDIKRKLEWVIRHNILLKN